MITISLTTELEAALIEAASQQHTSPEQLALETLHDRFVGNGEETPDDSAAGTLYDRFAGRLGLFDSSRYVPGGAQLSEDCGKKFAAGMVEKRRQGKL